MSEPTDLVPMSEAQERFGLSKMAIWRLVNSGRVTVYRTEADRRRKLVSLAAVEAAIRPRPADPKKEKEDAGANESRRRRSHPSAGSGADRLTES